ncbi:MULTISPECIES: bifunctional 3-(3-hydroxy-phenyl)propionate/3-hydroxycinnamic acid hydroxylase [Streptomyces]|uniref:3-(3-hydroxyphenyl)propionate hydroxylase n=1 Tax=Streptomyces capitiformicae TaxID=2014920 RepID=A0A919DN89_9ACTN|nr:bifunctional 3-(3-hydroxy-phenyl)propionate/3-hydroxycinnamic acid hydroxylase [Streptomyces capitiformicae]GHE58961.1 3-(3-hydroxyphenyl)propionate hydroxylase [Streptomyces capitiformicae]
MTKLSTGDFDVAIIGYGPVGQCAAALLGRAGHRVVVLERHPNLYEGPRATHIDQEVLRLLDAVGARESFDDYTPLYCVHVINGQGQPLAEAPSPFDDSIAYGTDYQSWQPNLEAALDGAVADCPSVELRRGFEVVDLRDLGGRVEIQAERQEIGDDGRRRGTGEIVRLTATYAIAADGANSRVREILGIERHDFGFEGTWANCDVASNVDFSQHPVTIGEGTFALGNHDLWMVMDPERDIAALPMGKSRRRFGWALLPDEDRAHFESEQLRWEVLGRWGLTANDVEVLSQTFYAFEARLAKKFRQGNVFLAGDAAHTMPPHMGMGMRTGIRDARNLSWKLDLVLRGLAPDAFLNSYEDERLPHSRIWIETSKAIGDTTFVVDTDEAAARDEAYRSGRQAPPAGNQFPLETGLKPHDPDQAALSGKMSPQGFVEREGVQAHLDALLPTLGFRIISVAGDPREFLGAAALAFLHSVDTSFVTLTSDSVVGEDEVIDVGGVYSDFMKENGIQVLVLRPDLYIFGAAARTDQVGTLVAALRKHIES